MSFNQVLLVRFGTLAAAVAFLAGCGGRTTSSTGRSEHVAAGEPDATSSGGAQDSVDSKKGAKASGGAKVTGDTEEQSDPDTGAGTGAAQNGAPNDVDPLQPDQAPTDPDGVPEIEEDDTPTVDPTGDVLEPKACAETNYAASPGDVASALAAVLWGTAPDEELLAAADAGELSAGADANTQVKRLLNDSRAHSHLGGFGQWWFGNPTITKSEEAFPEFDEKMAEDLRTSNRLFFESLFASGDTVGALLLSTEAYANRDLALLYGLDAEGLGDEFVRVALEPTERAGVFTQLYPMSLFGAVNPSPTKRGRQLEELALCTSVPALPPGVVLEPPQAEPDRTNRQSYEIAIADPTCVACHTFLTFPGFAFEHYDALGSYRLSDNGLPVDSSTTIMVDGETRGYDDAVQLMPDLAERQSVTTCLALHWLMYLTGHDKRSALGDLRSWEPELPCPAGDSCGTLENYVAEVSRCAGEPGPDLKLGQLVGRLASSPLLVDGTFACGSRRCFVGAEVCEVHGEADTDFCVMASEIWDCSTLPSECSCESTSNGGTVVKCP